MRLDQWKRLILASQVYDKLLYFKKDCGFFVGKIYEFLIITWKSSCFYRGANNIRSRFKAYLRRSSAFWKGLDRRWGWMVEAGIILTIALAPVLNSWEELLVLTIFLYVIRSPDRKTPDTGLFVFWLALMISSVMSLGVRGPGRLVIVTVWLLTAGLAGRTFSVEFSRKVIRWMLVAGLIWMLIGLRQQAAEVPTPSGWLEQGQNILISVRSFSVFGNPNIYGLYLLSILIFTLPEITGREVHYRPFSGLIIVLGVISLYYTYSRTAWILGLVAAGLWFGKRCFSRKYFFIWIIILCLSCLPGFKTRLFSPVSFLEGTFWFRVRIWRNMLNILTDFWLWGAGPGSFSEVYRSYPMVNNLVNHGHQLFLQLWLENGIFSLLAFLRVIIKNLAGVVNFQSFTKALALVISIFLMFGFLETWWVHQFSGGYFWLLIGLLQALKTGRTDS